MQKCYKILRSAFVVKNSVVCLSHFVNQYPKYVEYEDYNK